MTTPEQQPYDELAAEFLRFVEVEADPYRLQRAQTFLEMKFGQLADLRKEVEALRAWKRETMPAVVGWSELHNPPKSGPFDWEEE